MGLQPDPLANIRSLDLVPRLSGASTNLFVTRLRHTPMRSQGLRWFWARESRREAVKVENACAQANWIRLFTTSHNDCSAFTFRLFATKSAHALLLDTLYEVQEVHSKLPARSYINCLLVWKFG